MTPGCVSSTVAMSVLQQGWKVALETCGRDFEGCSLHTALQLDIDPTVLVQQCQNFVCQDWSQCDRQQAYLLCLNLRLFS